MTKSDLFLVATTLCLCGCATPIKVLDYYGADSATLAKIRDLQVVEDGALSEGGYTDLGVVNGLFCNRTPGDPDASADIAQRLARDQVDLRAAELGAEVDRIEEDNISFDLEIYDGATLAYAATGISESHHEVLSPLDQCKDYRWSVRPVYRVDGKSRAGEWMRYNYLNFMNFTKKTFDPETQQFWEGFPRLKTRC